MPKKYPLGNYRRSIRCQSTIFFSKNGHVREDGMNIHEYYLLRVKSHEESKAPWDYYEVISTISGEDANIPRAESKCSLMKRS